MTIKVLLNHPILFMGNYIQIQFEKLSADQSDVLIAQLNELGFTGFEELESVLKAFIPEEDFDRSLLLNSLEHNKISFTESFIKETNWNRVWESNFDPVIVEDFVAIRAEFHKPVPGVLYEIIITPKMSFGTGHHATTYMMIEQMRRLDFAGKSVFDFGTGTGVLAILAQKLGARKIIAVDNDLWSIENAKENFVRNNCTSIDIRLFNSADISGQFNIVLANINKNVILENIKHFQRLLTEDGALLLSGVLPEDKHEILENSRQHNLQLNSEAQRHNWLSLSLSRERIKF